jgi:serine/threonine protein kinase
MGVVYQARDLQSGHLVAVKILPWRVSIVPEWVARFEREARTAAQLRHRNIVPVFRYGQENGYCFFVMQFVNGIGLDRIIERLKEADGIINVDEIRVQQTQQPPQQEKLSNEALRRTGEVSSAEQESRRRLTRTSWSNFAKVAMQATQALRCAHAAGILHNDIKPGNLLLDGEGRIWVSDFGLSQPISPVGQKSLDRTISGTLKYMAPERLLGQQSAACDLYSLGATLYELCLQRPVFDHPDRDELVRMIMEEEPQRPRTICRDIPRGLETIITNCLAKHPTDRYATADAMLSDLLRYSKDQSVSSTYRSSFSGFFRAIRQSMRKRKAP